jgi:hypothetical protein
VNARSAKSTLATSASARHACTWHPHEASPDGWFPRRPVKSTDQVLTIVQEDQGLFGSQRVQHAVQQQPTGLFTHPQGRRERLRYARPIRHRCELEEPHTIVELVKQIGADVEGQASLAGPASPDDSQEVASRASGR